MSLIHCEMSWGLFLFIFPFTKTAPTFLIKSSGTNIIYHLKQKIMETKKLIEIGKTCLSHYNPFVKVRNNRIGEFAAAKRIYLETLRDENSKEFSFGSIIDLGGIFKMNVYSF